MNGTRNEKRKNVTFPDTEPDRIVNRLDYSLHDFITLFSFTIISEISTKSNTFKNSYGLLKLYSFLPIILYRQAVTGILIQFLNLINIQTHMLIEYLVQSLFHVNI